MKIVALIFLLHLSPNIGSHKHIKADKEPHCWCHQSSKKGVCAPFYTYCKCSDGVAWTDRSQYEPRTNSCIIWRENH